MQMIVWRRNSNIYSIVNKPIMCQECIQISHLFFHHAVTMSNPKNADTKTTSPTTLSDITYNESDLVDRFLFNLNPEYFNSLWSMPVKCV